MSTETNDLRNELRALTLGTAEFKRTEVEYKGKTFEIKELTAGAKEQVRKQASATVNKDGTIDLDQSLFIAYSIVESVVVPGTDTKVFGVEDVQGILNSPESGFYGVLGEAALKMMNGGEDEGNSETQAES